MFCYCLRDGLLHGARVMELGLFLLYTNGGYNYCIVSRNWLYVAKAAVDL